MNKALEALKEIEWMQVDEQMEEQCPVCKRLRSVQHAQWCRLDRAIGILKRQPKCKTCDGTKEILSDKSTKYITIMVPCPDCADAQLTTKDGEIIGLQEQLIKMCRVFHSIDCMCKWCNIAKERAIAGT